LGVCGVLDVYVGGAAVWVWAADTLDGFAEERAVDVRKPEEVVWPCAMQAHVQVPIERQS
jgi:hypothetical protein